VTDFEIPDSNLPEGFAASIEQVPDVPAVPRAAATVVLARQGASSMEILLMRRNRSSGFVPGAWVFPGGRVDTPDTASELTARTDGLTPEHATTRLGLDPRHEPGGLAYYLASVREAFEETGLLIARDAAGQPPPTAAADSSVDQLRSRVLDDEVLFAEALDAMGCRVAGDAIEYIAHWITPLVEPRRYDTRFFLAEVPSNSEAVVDPREMSAAQWLSPQAALERHTSGDLPMVFPTIHTLEQLLDFSSAGDAIQAFSRVSIPSILPRLVKTPTGVGLEIAEEI